MTLREFEIVFNKLYVPLGMYVLRIVDDIDDAEDIVQDVFVEIWERIRLGAEIDNMKSYLYMSVRNKALCFVKSKHTAMSFEDLDSSEEVSDEDIDTSERDARIWTAIDRLPDRCREIFLMSKRDGLSNEEIAEDLNLSIQTVKNQITKAFRSLREALGEGHRPFFLPFL